MAIESTAGRLRGPVAAVALLLLCLLLTSFLPPGADATFPGRNGKLVIARKLPGGERQVYIGTRSGDLRRLSRGFAYAADPDVSPNGERIAFTAARRIAGTANVYLIRPDGTGLRQLTRGGGAEPAFSPNGRFILFTRFVESRDQNVVEIARVSVASGNTGSIVLGPRSAAVSPDGRIFVAVFGRESELYAYRMNGSRIRRLTREFAFAEQPDFSPDGRWIAYRTNRRCPGGGEGPAIAVVNIAGTRRRTIVKDCRRAIEAPSFSPNGDLLTYFRNGVPRVVAFPGGGRDRALLRNRPRRAKDSALAWIPR